MFAKCHGRLWIGLAFALAMSVIAQAAPLACSGGVDKERAGSEIDKIVRKIMAENDLKAVIAGVAVDGKPVFTKAWGEVDDRRPGRL
jgi:CubicO group peptidase (beta-lactamase class C family)